MTASCSGGQVLCILCCWVKLALQHRGERMVFWKLNTIRVEKITRIQIVIHVFVGLNYLNNIRIPNLYTLTSVAADTIFFAAAAIAKYFIHVLQKIPLVIGLSIMVWAPLVSASVQTFFPQHLVGCHGMPGQVRPYKSLHSVGIAQWTLLPTPPLLLLLCKNGILLVGRVKYNAGREVYNRWCRWNQLLNKQLL